MFSSVERGSPLSTSQPRLVRYRTDNLLDETVIAATLCCIVVIAAAPGIEQFGCRATCASNGRTSQSRCGRVREAADIVTKGVAAGACSWWRSGNGTGVQLITVLAVCCQCFCSQLVSLETPPVV